MNRNKCVIIVPIYKSKFDDDEYNSIKQLFKILPISKYDIIAVCPESLDLTYYIENFSFFNFYKYWDSYFTDYPKGYNKLFLNWGFYWEFTFYDYMLIYQPDAWVFRDELEYWCNKEYDYIGAPQLYGYPDYLHCLKKIGNGGFSLRKIMFFYNICKKYEFLCNYICEINNSLIGEDRILTSLNEFGIDINMNLPSFYEAAHFSFDTNPSILYQLIDNKLPFGTHGYNKVVGNSFWKDFICYKKKRYSVVTFLFGDYDYLKDPLYVDEEAEYICITDRTDLKSNVWKFENITEYDISKYNDWQKSLIARYTALNHINTEHCVIIDSSILIKNSLMDFINRCTCGNIGVIINPFRESYLDEFDEWINKRNLNYEQKEDFINYCNNINFDYNVKGFIMITILYLHNNDESQKLMNYVLTELMNNFNFSIRIDQIYFSIILFKYFNYLRKVFFSYQILNSKCFNYYYHNTNRIHNEQDYNPKLDEIEIRKFCNENIICNYI